MKYRELNAQVQAVLTAAADEIAVLKGYEVIVSYRKKPNPNDSSTKSGVLSDFLFHCCERLMTPTTSIVDHTREGKYLTMRQAVIVAIKAKYKEAAAWQQIAKVMGYETSSGVIKAYTTGMGYLKHNDAKFTSYYNLLKPLL